MEAALRCWRSGSQVAIRYRRTDFDEKSVKKSICPTSKPRFAQGIFSFYPQSLAVEITPQHVVLLAPTDGQTRIEGKPIIHQTDFVLDLHRFSSGFAFIRACRACAWTARSASRITTGSDGNQCAGSVCSRNRRRRRSERYRLFIENCHEHIGKIVSRRLPVSGLKTWGRFPLASIVCRWHIFKPINLRITENDWQ